MPRLKRTPDMRQSWSADLQGCRPEPQVPPPEPAPLCVPPAGSNLRHPLQEFPLIKAVTCVNANRGVYGLGKHPSIVLARTRGFPTSCVPNPFCAAPV